MTRQHKRQDFSSAGSRKVSIGGLEGQLCSLPRSHSGPFHHIRLLISPVGDNPLEAGSAGLLLLVTCRQTFVGMKDRISEKRFPTNGLNLRGLPCNQPSTTVLSVQACISFIHSILLTWCRSFVTKTSPQSSSLGIESRLIGATFVLAMTIGMYGRHHCDL